MAGGPGASRRYATLIYDGNPNRLMEAHERLPRWMVEQGLGMASILGQGKPRRAGMFELYPKDPAVEPNLDQWESEVRYLIADAG